MGYGVRVHEITRRIDRSASTISRELRCNAATWWSPGLSGLGLVVVCPIGSPAARKRRNSPQRTAPAISTGPVRRRSAVRGSNVFAWAEIVGPLVARGLHQRVHPGVSIGVGMGSVADLVLAGADQYRNLLDPVRPPHGPAGGD